MVLLGWVIGIMWLLSISVSVVLGIVLVSVWLWLIGSRMWLLCLNRIVVGMVSVV